MVGKVGNKMSRSQSRKVLDAKRTKGQVSGILLFSDCIAKPLHHVKFRTYWFLNSFVSRAHKSDNGSLVLSSFFSPPWDIVLRILVPSRFVVPKGGPVFTCTYSSSMCFYAVLSLSHILFQALLFCKCILCRLIGVDT